MKRIVKYVASFALLVAILVGLGQIGIARSKADYNPGCENVGWGLNIFGSWTQRRIICDGVRRSDGSWNRVRMVYTPAGYVRGYCGTYSCYSGYYRDETIQAKETYVVTDFNVLPDEPAWLPPGTDTIR